MRASPTGRGNRAPRPMERRGRGAASEARRGQAGGGGGAGGAGGGGAGGGGGGGGAGWGPGGGWGGGWGGRRWGWGWGGWGPWGPDEETITHYTGQVLANLQGPGGFMRCHFTLMRPSAGMIGGGVGQCQLPVGTIIQAQFPPHY